MLSSIFPNCLFFSLSLLYDPGLSWHQPSDCGAKCWVSEEGHSLSVVFGTNTAVTFPLLYPSVGFGPLDGATEQIWPGFSKKCLYDSQTTLQDFYREYDQPQLNVGMETEFRALEREMPKRRGEVFPTVFTSLIFSRGNKIFLHRHDWKYGERCEGNLFRIYSK